MNYALFEDVLNPKQESSYLFWNMAEEICIYDFGCILDGLYAIERLSQRGYYLAGYIAYDAILGFEKRLKKLQSTTNSEPLIHFIAYKNYTKFASNNLAETLAKLGIYIQGGQLVNIRVIEFADNKDEFAAKFSLIQENLKKGNTYQVNLTTRVSLEFDPITDIDLYYQLSRAKPVEYGALLPFSPQTVISLSPELFFRKIGSNITVKPMKGTAQRGNTIAEDESNYNWLGNDEKNRAENLIIVDLLRNDLARICKTGSVNVAELFKVEKFTTVFQMISEINAQLPDKIRFSQIVRALFPCGSITGAPKLSTMQIIDDVERSNRGVYCGTVGFILPNNDMHFSVAIRTINKTEECQKYQIGVGGGITVRSEFIEEWQEMQTKLKFLNNSYYPDFNLVESLLYIDGQLHNLEQHLLRMKHSAERLLFEVDINYLRTKLTGYFDEKSSIFQSGQKYKVRVSADYKGRFEISHSELHMVNEVYKVRLLKIPLNSSSVLFHHKTTAKEVRGLYDQLYLKYKPNDIDELIFINQDGIITESRYFNVLLEYDGQWITSPVKAGLLPGVYRQNLLDQGKLVEVPITAQMLEDATQVYLCNDVRGLIYCDYLGWI